MKRNDWNWKFWLWKQRCILFMFMDWIHGSMISCTSKQEHGNRLFNQHNFYMKAMSTLLIFFQKNIRKLWTAICVSFSVLFCFFPEEAFLTFGQSTWSQMSEISPLSEYPLFLIKWGKQRCRKNASSFLEIVLKRRKHSFDTAELFCDTSGIPEKLCNVDIASDQFKNLEEYPLGICHSMKERPVKSDSILLGCTVFFSQNWLNFKLYFSF